MKPPKKSTSYKDRSVGGTEMSPGGTEMSPGAVFRGTEMSPGGGTEMSPGGGTEMSPGAIFRGTEMSPGGGTEISPGGGTEMSPGAIFRGTEMSPGGGTEISPGGGTEMSPGAIFRGSRFNRVAEKYNRRTDALFRALSTDFLLREQFVTDPSQILSEYLYGKRLTDEASDAANQLLYCVLSNPRLRRWMADYSRHLKGSTPTTHQFAVEFARAVAKQGDELTALSLIRTAAEGRGDFVVQADLLRSIISVIGSRFSSGGTEVSPGGGTEVSPGGGTEVSPGAIFRGTDMSPGGGTNISPGGGTNMSPGAIFSGTDMSPGGGTNISPGGGTNISPGALGSLELPGYLQVTFSALVQYASQLRARGVLVSSGLEFR